MVHYSEFSWTNDKGILIYGGRNNAIVVMEFSDAGCLYKYVEGVPTTEFTWADYFSNFCKDKKVVFDPWYMPGWKWLRRRYHANKVIAWLEEMKKNKARLIEESLL